MKFYTKYPMSAGDVARELGVSAVRVRQLDEQLKPVRGHAGHRRYSVEVVQRFIAKRAAKRRPRGRR